MLLGMPWSCMPFSGKLGGWVGDNVEKNMLISHKTCFLILLRVPGQVHGLTLWLILRSKWLVNLKIALIPLQGILTAFF